MANEIVNTITKSKNSVDIRITKYDKEIIREDLNIPISMDAYYSLVSEMAKGCNGVVHF